MYEAKTMQRFERDSAQVNHTIKHAHGSDPYYDVWGQCFYVLPITPNRGTLWVSPHRLADRMNRVCYAPEVWLVKSRTLATVP